MIFDSVVWFNFAQAVKYSETYNDQRSIVNCSFKHDQKNEKRGSVDSYTEYAFDLANLGDACRFEHNSVDSTINGKGVRLRNCGGASIQGNIINSDALFQSCKGVVFNANHCEEGIQLEIIDSQISMNSNFIYRGSRPNVYIHSSGYGDKSVVSMSNDMLIQIGYSDSEYDISLDADTILDISNVFRYDMISIGFGKMYPFGINIQKADNSSLDAFNNYSYIASCNSKITSGYRVNLQETIKNVNSSRIYTIMLNSHVKWLGDSGDYCYYYQILWDKDRNIKKTASTTNTSDSVFLINWEGSVTSSPEHKTLAKNGSGILIGMSADVNGNCSMVRLIRKKVVNQMSSYEIVDIPVCGTRYIYDNGVSVCGYKWKALDTQLVEYSEACDKNMEMFRINNGNVECFTKKEGGITPTAGWKRGDIIYNIGTTPSVTVVPDDII